MLVEDKIIEALNYAKGLGVQIARGPIFDWVWPNEPRIREIPYTSNTIGAIFLKLNKANFVSNDEPYFIPGGMKIIYDYLEVNDFWIWRFEHGFNGGYQITFTVKQKDGKEKTVKDDVSSLGITIRKMFI